MFTTDGQGYICETEPKYHEPTKHLYYSNDELNEEIESDLEYSMSQQRQYLIGFMKRETAKKLAKALDTTSLCGYIYDLDGNMYFERKCDGDLTRERVAHRSTKENILSKNWTIDTTMPEPFHEFELHNGWWSDLKDIHDIVKENWDEWKDLCKCQIYEGEWCKKSNEVNDLPTLLTNYITMSGGKTRRARRARKSRKSRNKRTIRKQRRRMQRRGHQRA